MSASVRRVVRPPARLWKRLQNPFALVVEGFLIGALLFFTFHPFAEAAPAAARDGGGSLLSNLQV